MQWILIFRIFGRSNIQLLGKTGSVQITNIRSDRLTRLKIPVSGLAGSWTSGFLNSFLRERLKIILIVCLAWAATTTGVLKPSSSTSRPSIKQRRGYVGFYQVFKFYRTILWNNVKSEAWWGLGTLTEHRYITYIRNIFIYTNHWHSFTLI